MNYLQPILKKNIDFLVISNNMSQMVFENDQVGQYSIKYRSNCYLLIFFYNDPRIHKNFYFPNLYGVGRRIV